MADYSGVFSLEDDKYDSLFITQEPRSKSLGDNVDLSASEVINVTKSKGDESFILPIYSDISEPEEFEDDVKMFEKTR